MINKSIKSLQHNLLAIMLIENLSPSKAAKACKLHPDTIRRLIYDGSTTKNKAANTIYTFVHQWVLCHDNIKHLAQFKKFVKQMQARGTGFALNIIDPIKEDHFFFQLKPNYKKKRQQKTPFIVVSIISVLMFVICLIILTSLIDV